MGVDWRFIAFSAKNAQRACAAALEGLLRTFEHPCRPELKKWAVAQKKIFETILSDRKVKLNQT